MYNWLIISLIVIILFFIFALITNTFVFISYSSYRDAKEEWKLYKQALENKGYKINLIQIKFNNCTKVYCFYYTKR